MAKPLIVKFYFDYRSPFSYLAKDPVYQLERDFNVKIAFKPLAFPLTEAFGHPDVIRNLLPCS